MTPRRERLAGWTIATLAGAMVLFTVWPPLAALRYVPARDALWHGAPAQLIHLGMPHLMLNLCGLAVCTLVARRHAAWAPMLGALVVSAMVVAIGLRWDVPPLAWYVGLSGALYGVTAWLALAHICWLPSAPWRVLAVMCCVMIGAKAVVGVHAPAGPGTWLGIPPAPTAHLYGYAGGLVFAALWAAYRGWRARAA
ncbi:MAG: rhomboid family intramembrane serine protease [Rhodocyclaceae bacterium]